MTLRALSLLFDSWITGHDIVVLIIGIVGTGGISAALIGWYKLKPEAGQIMVTTAQGVLLVQTGVIDTLNAELERVSDELKEVRKDHADCERRIRALERRRRSVPFMNNSEAEDHPFSDSKRPEAKHDLDLGDGHWIDWSNYKDERCGGIITHTTVKNETGFCQGAFTIKGSKWDVEYPGRAHWEFSGTPEVPTLAPSFLCHCGDHGFVREGKWVRA